MKKRYEEHIVREKDRWIGREKLQRRMSSRIRREEQWRKDRHGMGENGVGRGRGR